jgi:hypothetical protein
MGRCEHPWETCQSKATHTFRSERPGGFAYQAGLCMEHLIEEVSGGIGYDRTVTITPVEELPAPRLEDMGWTADEADCMRKISAAARDRVLQALDASDY